MQISTSKSVSQEPNLYHVGNRYTYTVDTNYWFPDNLTKPLYVYLQHKLQHSEYQIYLKINEHYWAYGFSKQKMNINSQE